jgi:hypothetical protein
MIGRNAARRCTESLHRVARRVPVGREVRRQAVQLRSLRGEPPFAHLEWRTP